MNYKVHLNSEPIPTNRQAVMRISFQEANSYQIHIPYIKIRTPFERV